MIFCLTARVKQIAPITIYVRSCEVGSNHVVVLGSLVAGIARNVGGKVGSPVDELFGGFFQRAVIGCVFDVLDTNVLVLPRNSYGLSPLFLCLGFDFVIVKNELESWVGSRSAVRPPHEKCAPLLKRE